MARMTITRISGVPFEAFTHADVQANGITIHTVSTGEGPLVLFCHGVPGILVLLAASTAGRGRRRVPRGRDGHAGLRRHQPRPEEIAAYSLSHLVGGHGRCGERNLAPNKR